MTSTAPGSRWCGCARRISLTDVTSLPVLGEGTRRELIRALHPCVPFVLGVLVTLGLWLCMFD